MTAVGADVEQLRSASKNFSQGVNTLRSAVKTLNTLVSDQSIWRGRDADQFRSEWKGQSVSALNAAINALQEAADALRRNADQQETASRADGGAISANGSGAPVKGATDIGGSAPSSTSEMWKKIQSFDRTENSSGYRLQRIIGEDGEIRYIVYIGGTAASDGQTLLSNIPAAKGELDEKQVAALKRLIDPPDAEVMLVGFSQGGMDAQNIAKNTDLNVKQIVTFGSPSRSDLDVPAVHLRAEGDVVPISTTVAPAATTIVGGMFGGVQGAVNGAAVGSNPFFDSMFQQGGNNEYFTAKSDASLSHPLEHDKYYADISKQYDENGSKKQFGNAQRFNGTVVDEVDLTVKGDYQR
jgi:uncharacterized protein YukE